MTTVSSSRHIEAPPADVWAAVTDLHGAADRISAITTIEVLSEGEFGVGTRWRETRIMFKRECTEEMWVTAVDPGRSYDAEARSCGSRYNSRISVEPDGDGTLLTMSMTATPETIMARIMSPMMLVFKGALKKCLDGDLEDIRTSLVGPSATGAVAV